MPPSGTCRTNGSALARGRSKTASSLAVGKGPSSSEYFTLIWSQRSSVSSSSILIVVLMETALTSGPASAAEPAASIAIRPSTIDCFETSLLIISPYSCLAWNRFTPHTPRPSSCLRSFHSAHPPSALDHQRTTRRSHRHRTQAHRPEGLSSRAHAMLQIFEHRPMLFSRPDAYALQERFLLRRPPWAMHSSPSRTLTCLAGNLYALQARSDFCSAA